MPRPPKQIPFESLPDHFDVKTLAKFLHKRQDHIYQLCRSGEIPSRQIGRCIMIVKNQFGLAWGYIQPGADLVQSLSQKIEQLEDLVRKLEGKVAA